MSARPRTRMPPGSTVTSTPAARSLPITASRCSGTQSRSSTLPRVMAAATMQRPRLDAIGDDGVLDRLQLVHAFDGDERRAGAVDAGAHLVEHARQLLDLGLAGAVLQGRAAVGQRGGHHEVLGAGDRDQVEDDGGAAQASGARADVSVLERDRAPIASRPLRCWSMGRAPMAQPPGSDTLASP